MKNDISGNPLTSARIIIMLLKQEMSLTDSQIWLTNQNKKLSNDDDLYLTAGMVDSQVISNNRIIEDQGDSGLYESQIVTLRENIQIDIFSKSNDAEFRRWEVIAALQSVYSQQLQEENQFKIFRIPSSFLNTSGAEGGSNINRFSVIVPCHVWYKKTKLIDTPSGDIFTKFPARVDDEETISEDSGLFDMNLSDWIESESWIDSENWIE